VRNLIKSINFGPARKGKREKEKGKGKGKITKNNVEQNYKLHFNTYQN
jgi:hypothetical protein